MRKHTQGPWRVGGTESRVIFAANGDVVARTAAYGEQSETPDAEKGNAALIAAAPDLLAALKWAVRHIEVSLGPSGEKLSEARAAIAKATGVQS